MIRGAGRLHRKAPCGCPDSEDNYRGVCWGRCKQDATALQTWRPTSGGASARQLIILHRMDDQIRSIFVVPLADDEHAVARMEYE